MKKYPSRLILIVLFSFFHLSTLLAQQDNLEMVVDLKGPWRFSLGDSPEWRVPGFNDRSWESIQVPSPWEDQDFPGYNGYACYRKNTIIPYKCKGQLLFLKLGFIDDVDEVYFNGRKIGSTGCFPPHFLTSYQAERMYYIPEKLIRYNEPNQITVRVYDIINNGGIVSGDVGIYTNNLKIKVDVNILGTWKFHPGDNMKWKDPAFDDSRWKDIFVPSIWENQGYKNLDGFAWYRKAFLYDKSLPVENMVLLLGKIDDLDQVFLNGVLIGSTNLGPENKSLSINGKEYQEYRGYNIPNNLIRLNRVNTIAVRVYDPYRYGGIYEGPIGILTKANFANFQYYLNRNR